MTDLVERLRSKNCCSAENCNCDEAADEIERLTRELAESQAREAKLREGLGDVDNPINAMHRDLQEGYQLDGHMALRFANDPEHLKRIARKALTLPTDHTALDTLLRNERAKERERCARECAALAECEENTDGYRNGAAWCVERLRSLEDE